MLIHYLITLSLLLIAVISVFFSNKKSKNKICLVLFFLIFFVFAAFRSVNVGNDTVEYKRVFDSISFSPSLNEAVNSTRYEAGYVTYNYLLSKITNNFQAVLIINSAIYIAASLWFINKYSKNTNKTILLFFTFGLYYLIMNIERQCIAISIFLFAIPFLENKKYIKYSALILLATLFHSISIILLALIIIPKIDLSKSKNIIKWGIIGVIILALSNFTLQWIISLFPYFQHYFNNSIYAKGGTRIASVIMCLIRIIMIGIIIIINKGKFKNIKSEKELVLNKLLYLDFIISIASIGFNLYDRIEKFVCIGCIVAIVNQIEVMKNPINQKIAYGLLLIISFAYLTISLILRPEWSGIFPYSFYS